MALSWLAPCPAAAQRSDGDSGYALVLPSVPASDATEDWAPAVGAVAGTLEVQGTRAWSSDAARTRFEERHSREPSSVSLDDVNRWVGHSQAGIRHLARGDYAAASAELEKAERFMQGAADELNREAERARKVLDTCLFIVRTLVEQRDTSEALQQALECRRLAPRIEPSPYVHTPETMEVLERADAILADAPPATLRVTSEPSGCTVRINGVAIDETPFVADDLAAGDYRVQVECDADGEEAPDPTRRGRVHRIRVEEGAAHLHVDARFDAVVRTDDVLRLVYGSAQAEERHRLEDATEVAAILDAAQVLLLTPVDGALRIDRARDGRVIASAVVPSEATTKNGARRLVPEQAELEAAVAALREGRSIDARQDPPQPMTPWEPPPAAPDARAVASAEGTGIAKAGDAARGSEAGATAPSGSGGGPSRAHRITGATVGAAGLVGLATSWGLWARLQDRNDYFAKAFPGDVDYLSRQDEVDSAKSAVIGVAVAGGALTTAAVPLLLPAEDGVPWWAWATGGVGAGLAVWGLLPFVTDDLPPLLERDCIDKNEGACTRRQQTRVLGAMLWMHAAPMLAVPITYLVRDLTGGDGPVQDAGAAIELGPGRATLRLGGRF